MFVVIGDVVDMIVFLCVIGPWHCLGIPPPVPVRFFSAPVLLLDAFDLCCLYGAHHLPLVLRLLICLHWLLDNVCVLGTHVEVFLCQASGFS